MTDGGAQKSITNISAVAKLTIKMLVTLCIDFVVVTAMITWKKIANNAVLEAENSNINTTTPFGCGHCNANFSFFDSLKKHITGTYNYIFLFQHFSFVLTISDSTVLAPVRSSLI